jgi:DNA-binding CsgD family transcriptional regulator
MATGPVNELRDALAAVVSADVVLGEVREQIVASWRRSAGSGLRPETFDVPHDPTLDADAPLMRAARPVIDELTDDLATVSLGIVVTNVKGQVLERRASDHSVRSLLDRIMLAPGFLYTEEHVGTNAIGTALEEGRPSIVDGPEHFAETLTTMSCAAWPIADVRSGQVLGVVDLSCAARDGSPLMLPLARRAARDIGERLLEEASTVERLLLRRFDLERRRVGGPLVFINGRTMLTNASAGRIVGSTDEEVLWDCALHMLASNRSDGTVVLESGTFAVRSCDAVIEGGEVIGASMRLGPVSPAAPLRRSSQQARPTLGWGSLTDTELSVTSLVRQGLTNRGAAERLLMSRYTVDSHLRSIFRKLDISSRVELTRAAVEHDSGGQERPGVG